MRMDGTVVSDAVNLASRMEGLTKLYGSSIIMSSDAFFKLEDPTNYSYRFLDLVQVKGKKDPVSVVEILDGDSKEDREKKVATKPDFEYALYLYRNAEFSEAGTFFRKVLEICQDDKAASLYLKRCEYYEEHGVMSGWKGIEVLDVK